MGDGVGIIELVEESETFDLSVKVFEVFSHVVGDLNKQGMTWMLSFRFIM